MDNSSWKTVQGYLPAGWAAQAQETKALQRGREIKTADDLLMLNMLYLTVGGLIKQHQK